MIYLNNIYLLMPEIFLSGVVTALLGYGVIYSKLEGRVSQHEKVIYISILSLAIAFVMALDILSSHLDAIALSSVGIGGLFLSNSLTSFAKVFVLGAGIGVLFLYVPFSKEEKQLDYETPLVIILAIIGMLLLTSSEDMIVFYLAIELLSLSFYVLATLNKEGQYSTEAGLKYFLLGALSSALLLLGFRILYGVTGETSFEGIQYYG
jgi:NADH-quinone oxidoreductase subunit N